MVDNLKIKPDINKKLKLSNHPDPVLRVIETFKYHRIYDWQNHIILFQLYYPRNNFWGTGKFRLKKAYKEIDIPINIAKSLTFNFFLKYEKALHYTHS